MALKPSIALRQKQRLAVTQKMQQSVAILGMSNAELLAFLKEEETENPVIKISHSSPAHTGPATPVDIVIAETSVAHETFISSLLRQLAAADIPAALLQPVKSIVENLDDRGFLETPLQHLAISGGFLLTDMEYALEIVQALEPVGIAARSPAECLELQLKSDNLWSGKFETLIKLILSGSHQAETLATALGITVPEVRKMLDRLKRYSLNPAESHDTPPIAGIIPDVICTRQHSGELSFTLNEEAFPRLQSDSAYLDGSLAKENQVKEYLDRQIARVHWLRRALEKRASTILRISIAIGNAQAEFFDKGAISMKPLKMGQIAQTLKIHESTVSRAISGKFLTCELGTFPLRFFFPSAVTNQKGGAVSSTMIRWKISQIIHSEEAKNIHSDKKIADLLAKDGIVVARRTIAKYRDLMNVPTSSIRRIQKRAQSRS